MPPVATCDAAITALEADREAASSLLQLGINLADIVIAGTLTLLIQSWLWRRVN